DAWIYLAGSGTVSRTTPVTIDVKPVPTETVSGQVIANGAPLGQATVLIRSIFDVEPVELNTTTDDAGHYTLDNVPAGAITITAFLSWNEAGRATGPLTGGGTLSRDVTIDTAATLNYALVGTDGFRYEFSTGGELRSGGSPDGTIVSPFSYSVWNEVNG